MTFGVFADNIILTYQETIWKGILAAAKALDINIVTFVGSPISSPFQFQAKRNSVYKLVSKKNINGLIYHGYVHLHGFDAALRCSINTAGFENSQKCCQEDGGQDDGAFHISNCGY